MRIDDPTNTPKSNKLPLSYPRRTARRKGKHQTRPVASLPNRPEMEEMVPTTLGYDIDSDRHLPNIIAELKRNISIVGEDDPDEIIGLLQKMLGVLTHREIPQHIVPIIQLGAWTPILAYALEVALGKKVYICTASDVHAFSSLNKNAVEKLTKARLIIFLVMGDIPKKVFNLCMHINQSAFVRTGLNRPEHSVERTATAMIMSTSYRYSLPFPPNLESLIFPIMATTIPQGWNFDNTLTASMKAKDEPSKLLEWLSYGSHRMTQEGISRIRSEANIHTWRMKCDFIYRFVKTKCEPEGKITTEEFCNYLNSYVSGDLNIPDRIYEKAEVSSVLRPLGHGNMPVSVDGKPNERHYMDINVTDEFRNQFNGKKKNKAKLDEKYDQNQGRNS